MKIASNVLIDALYASRPRIIWEMDNYTLRAIKKIKDDNGTYLWLPEPNYSEMPGTLMGHQISLSSNKCLQLKYLFADGTSYVSNIAL